MQKETSEILPLYIFFDRLRQNEFPLGIEDYEKFLVALRKHFGLTINGYSTLLTTLQHRSSTIVLQDTLWKNRLLNLCKLLWLKPNQNIRVFEDIFEESFLLDASVGDKTKELKTENTFSGIPQAEEGKSDRPLQDGQNNQNPVVSQGQDVQQGVQDETVPHEENIAVRIAVSEHRSEDELKLKQDRTHELENSKFLFTHDYFPVDKRKTQQNLRQFPLFQYTLITNEIDIDATIRKVVEKGFFNEAVWKKRKFSNINIILLIDHLGSMIAFEQLSNIIRTELEKLLGPQKRQKEKTLRIFYFYNCPAGHLYTTRTHTKSQSLNSILNQLKGKSASIIVVSDAGAARGTYNLNRINSTKELLRKLYGCTKKIAWLNPMPKERWENTAAETIANYVAMFEANETGIKNAVDILKGKSTKLIKME